MTQPLERLQIAATVDGQPIFVPRQVASGESQPVGEFADGQPVWPLLPGVEPQAGPVPFGLLSSGQPVWAQASKATRPFYKKKRVLIPAACVVLLGFAGAGGDGGSATDTVSASTTATADDKAADEAAANDKAAVDKAAAEKAAAEKAAAEKAAAQKAAADKAAADKAAEKAAAGTVSQQNAVEKAESYLDFSAFSRTELIEQLEFNGFSPADATYGVDKVNPDWNEQAAKKAKSYLDFSAFSRSELIDQLVFNGFTAAQAEYGVSQTGL